MNQEEFDKELSKYKLVRDKDYIGSKSRKTNVIAAGTNSQQQQQQQQQKIDNSPPNNKNSQKDLEMWTLLAKFARDNGVNKQDSQKLLFAVMKLHKEVCAGMVAKRKLSSSSS